MKKLSREFLVRLKLDKRPAYEIARHANVDQTFLSKAIHGAIRIDRVIDRVGDRIERVGEVLGLSPTECWENVEVVSSN